MSAPIPPGRVSHIEAGKICVVVVINGPDNWATSNARIYGHVKIAEEFLAGRRSFSPKFNAMCMRLKFSSFDDNSNAGLLAFFLGDQLKYDNATTDFEIVKGHLIDWARVAALTASPE